jgi:hypothetical protein
MTDPPLDPHPARRAPPGNRREVLATDDRWRLRNGKWAETEAAR